MTTPSHPAISRALKFIDTLRVNDSRSEYYEVAELDHSEHRVYNQSQYLLTLLFKKVGRIDLAQAIRRKHRPDEPDNDLPRRKGHIACDRWCILEGDIAPFYLKNRINSSYNDEKALLALYWLEKGSQGNAKRIWKQLHSRYDSLQGVLKMDKADRERSLYPVYKVALLGILARKMNKPDIAGSVEGSLRRWQNTGGGWETDRTPILRPDGVANIETTALSILALL